MASVLTATACTDESSLGSNPGSQDAGLDGSSDPSADSDGSSSEAGDERVCDPDPRARIEPEIRANLAAEVDQLFGRFARGEYAVYRGTASALDNHGSLPRGEDGEFSSAVIALLREIDGTREEELALFSPSTQKHVSLFQLRDDPTATYVRTVQPTGRYGGPLGTAVSALPGLASHPTSLSFATRAVGQWPGGAVLHVDVSATLERVALEQLRFTDLQLLGGLLIDNAFSRFTPVGSEFVRTVTGGRYVPACTPSNSGFLDNECGYAARFSAVEYVSANALASYGFRDLVVQPEPLCCVHCDLWGLDDRCHAGYRQACFP
jgi:hypothetical protein